MTFFEHLSELRKRIINSLYAIGIGAMVGVYVSKYVINWIIRPIIKALTEAHLDPTLVYTHPAGYLNTYITLGVYIGIVLASPIVLYQIWLFVAPALYKHERSAITGFLFSTVFLFLAGIAFGYFVTLPYILRFLVSFQGPISSIKPMITVNEYFDLTLMVLLGLGLVFELPILIFFLFVALRHCYAEISLEEFPLRHSSHRDRGRHRDAHSRCHDHAHFHGADGRTLFCGDCRLRHRDAAARATAGCSRGGALDDFVDKETSENGHGPLHPARRPYRLQGQWQRIIPRSKPAVHERRRFRSAANRR